MAYTPGALTNIKISAGASSDLRSDVTFSNLNGVSFGLNAGTVTASVAVQTNQSLGLYAVGNTEGASSSSTFDARTLSFQGKGAASVGFSNGTVVIDAPSAAAGNVTFSAGANSAGLGSVVFSNSNGVSFGLNGSTITASAAGGAGGGTGSLYFQGNTTQNSSSTQDYSSVQFGGLGAISVGYSGGTIQVSAPATSSLVGSGGISLSTNGNTITVSNAQINAYEPLPFLQANTMVYVPVASSWYLQPMYMEQPLSGGRWNVLVAHGSTASNFRATTTNFASNTTGTLSITGTYGRNMALYSIGAGTNSTRLESLWSNVWPLSFTHVVQISSGGATSMTVSQSIQLSGISSIDSLGSTTQGVISFSGSGSAAASSVGSTILTSIATSINNYVSSQMMIPIPFNTTINPGLYYVGMMWASSSGSSATGAAIASSLVNTLSIVNKYAIFGNSNTLFRQWLQTAVTSGSQIFPGVGVYSAASSAPPATIAFSDIRTQASNPLNYLNYVNSTI